MSDGVVGRVRDAFARGDRAELARLINTRPIEVWFGMLPSEIHEVVGSLEPGAVSRNSVGGFLLGLALGDSLEGGIGADPHWAAAMAADDELRKAWVFLQATQARVAGDPERSYEIIQPLLDTPIRSTMYVDTSGGLDGLVLLQAALAAALAGRVVEALTLYDRLLLVAPREPELSFYTREAYLRSALLLALYGDRAEARMRWEHARRVARTGSWVESQLDVEEILVDAALAPLSEARAAVDRVVGIPLQHLHEMWPYYVVVLHRLTVTTDLRARGRERIEALEATGIAPPRGTGSGLVADVFHISYGWDFLATGNAAAAKKELDQADAASPGVRLLLGLHALITGSPTRALQLARGLQPHFRRFDQFEAARLALIAAAHFVSHETDEAQFVLSQLAPLIDDYTMALLLGLSGELAAFAAERVAEWPAMATAPTGRPGVLDGDLLTPREFEVLAELARGHTRDEIARSLFLSVNTVKTHQQSLYRKLGASSVSSAVAEGTRRGLV